MMMGQSQFYSRKIKRILKDLKTIFINAKFKKNNVIFSNNNV